MLPRRALVVTGTFLLSVLLYVDRVCISTAKGPITKELGLTDTQFGWVMSSFAIGYALFQTPSGMLADKSSARVQTRFGARARCVSSLNSVRVKVRP